MASSGFPTIIETANRFRQGVINVESAQAQRLVSSYQAIAKDVQQQIDNLVLKIQAEGGTMTRGQMMRLDRYGKLITDIENRVGEYGAFSKVEIRQTTGLLLNESAKHTQAFTYMQLQGLNTDLRFNHLPQGAVESMMGFLDEEGAMFQHFNSLGARTAQGVSQALLSNLALGQNPVTIGRAMSNAFGLGLTEALRTARTANLWAYREGNRANYLANADVLAGWVWFARLDGDVCVSCVAEHGNFYPLSEPLNDHYNGRCIPIPQVKGFPPVLEPGAGEEWFRSLPEDQQVAIMGKARLDALNEGHFTFSELTKIHDDPVYGPMKTEASLKSILASRTETTHLYGPPTDHFVKSGATQAEVEREIERGQIALNDYFTKDIGVNGWFSEVGEQLPVQFKPHTKMSGNEHGAYVYLQSGSKGGIPTRIEIDAEYRGAALTQLHEQGHFFDQQVFGMGMTFGSEATWVNVPEVADALAQWEKAVADTHWFSLHRTFSADGGELGRYADYALQEREIFAQTFAQRIAEKDPELWHLGEGLAKEDGVLARWFNEADWARVKPAFDNLVNVAVIVEP